MSELSPAPRVLIIEDNLELAENMAELLEELEVETRILAGREEALEVATREGFDLALVDVRLSGGQSGILLVPELRARAPGGEIILVTGNATLDSAIAAIRHGVFAYVLKPFDPETLISLADRALAQVALRRERSRLARQLRSSEALYRGVVDTVEALIVGVDDEGRIVFCNRYAQELSGLEGAEAIGLLFAEHCLEEGDREGFRKDFAKVLRGGTVRDRQWRLPIAGGAHDVRWSFTPLSSSDERIAALAVGIDVTERLELERRSAESEALAAIGTLTAGLAHEIRNPLNAATLQLELLSRSTRRLSDAGLRDRIEGRVKIVRSELGRLTSMLDEFLGLARPDRLRAAEISVRELIEEVVALKVPEARAAGVEVRVEIRTGALGDPRVLGQRDKLAQVLLNLIANSVEAMRAQPSGEIRLRVEESGEGVRIAVQDNGPGIDPRVGEELFKPFVTSKEAGTGLGLPIAQKIVRMHGGELTLESGPEGTIAAFTLPGVAR